MPARREEYRLPDGGWSPHRRDAVVVAPSDVADAIHRRDAVVGRTVIPLRYFLATARHESNLAVNERDTEPPAEDGHVVVTFGLFQVEEEEAAGVGMAGADLLDLKTSVEVMVRLAEHNRQQIRAWAGLDSRAPDPPDLCAYLAIRHNQGPGPTRRTILRYGVDWRSPAPRGYRARNLKTAQAAAEAEGVSFEDYVRQPGNGWLRVITSGYGDDCLGP